MILRNMLKTIYMPTFQGYVKQIRKRPEMFPIEKVTIIFSNIEDIYVFATELLTELEKSTNTDQPHLSELGHCFLNKVCT